MPVELTITEGIRTILDLLIKPTKTKYYYLFETTIVSKDKSINNSKSIFEMRGDLTDVRESNRVDEKIQ